MLLPNVKFKLVKKQGQLSLKMPDIFNCHCCRFVERTVTFNTFKENCWHIHAGFKCSHSSHELLHAGNCFTLTSFVALEMRSEGNALKNENRQLVSLHDNAPAHRSILVKDCSAKKNVPSSPDMNPADFTCCLDWNQHLRNGALLWCQGHP
jgi:hypothetical protein